MPSNWILNYPCKTGKGENFEISFTDIFPSCAILYFINLKNQVKLTNATFSWWRWDWTNVTSPEARHSAKRSGNWFLHARCPSALNMPLHSQTYSQAALQLSLIHFICSNQWPIMLLCSPLLQKLQDLHERDSSKYASLTAIVTEEVEQGTAKKTKSCTRAIIWLSRYNEFWFCLAFMCTMSILVLTFFLKCHGKLSTQVDKLLKISTGKAADSPRVEPGRDCGRSLCKNSKTMAWLDLISCLQGITVPEHLLRIPCGYNQISENWLFTDNFLFAVMVAELTLQFLIGLILPTDLICWA